jgi:hypothetical protein
MPHKHNEQQQFKQFYHIDILVRELWWILNPLDKLHKLYHLVQAQKHEAFPYYVFEDDEYEEYDVRYHEVLEVVV